REWYSGPRTRSRGPYGFAPPAVGRSRDAVPSGRECVFPGSRDDLDENGPQYAGFLFWARRRTFSLGGSSRRRKSRATLPPSRINRMPVRLLTGLRTGLLKRPLDYARQQFPCFYWHARNHFALLQSYWDELSGFQHDPYDDAFWEL